MPGFVNGIRPSEIPDVSKVCSVYRRELGLYDYYLVRNPPGMKLVQQNNPIGIALADALPELPRPARLIGRGERAIGTIASDAHFSLPFGEIIAGAAIAGAVSALVGWLLRG